MRRWFYRGQHRATRFRLTVLDIKWRLFIEAYDAQFAGPQWVREAIAALRVELAAVSA